MLLVLEIDRGLIGLLWCPRMSGHAGSRGTVYLHRRPAAAQLCSFLHRRTQWDDQHSLWQCKHRLWRRGFHQGNQSPPRLCLCCREDRQNTPVNLSLHCDGLMSPCWPRKPRVSSALFSHRVVLNLQSGQLAGVPVIWKTLVNVDVVVYGKTHSR